MAQTINTRNGLAVIEELTITGPSSTTVYGTEISVLKPNFTNNNRWVTVTAKASATPTGTLTIDLYAANSSGGTKYQIKANIITLSDATTTAALVDLNAYPAPYYYIGIQSTGNDSGHTFDVSMVG